MSSYLEDAVSANVGAALSALALVLTRVHPLDHPIIDPIDFIARHLLRSTTLKTPSHRQDEYAILEEIIDSTEHIESDATLDNQIRRQKATDALFCD